MGALPREVVEEWLGNARAAIEAMREPTDAMLDAACEGIVDPELDEREAKALHRIDARDQWRAMIDAALAETA